jgi:uncharacterized protein (TIGR01244 family)
VRPSMFIAVALFAVRFTVSATAQEVTKETFPGISNFSRLESIAACSGAIQKAAVPEIKKMGYVSIINLREASEAGANTEEEAAAARAAGLRYFHIPFNAASPDPAAVDKFIEVITTEGTQPAFIHCSLGGRAATMWFIKRLVVDHWDLDRAEKEAASLGMNSASLKTFAIRYAQTHRR